MSTYYTSVVYTHRHLHKYCIYIWLTLISISSRSAGVGLNGQWDQRDSVVYPQQSYVPGGKHRECHTPTEDHPPLCPLCQDTKYVTCINNLRLIFTPQIELTQLRLGPPCFWSILSILLYIYQTARSTEWNTAGDHAVTQYTVSFGPSNRHDEALCLCLCEKWKLSGRVLAGHADTWLSGDKFQVSQLHYFEPDEALSTLSLQVSYDESWYRFNDLYGWVA